jgi:CheY-like chemotaxis protein
MDPLASGQAGLLGTCLVVEDDSIIRLDIEETLRGFGFSCVLGASTLEAAADLAATAALAFAVLDYEIGRCNTVALAEQLLARGVPLVFLTAHGQGVELPPSLAGLQVVGKPYSSAMLAEALLRTFAATGQPIARSIPCISLTG